MYKNYFMIQISCSYSFINLKGSFMGINQKNPFTERNGYHLHNEYILKRSISVSSNNFSSEFPTYPLDIQ